jgi:DNA processing protein
VPSLVHLTPLDAGYPSRLRTLDDPPPCITTSGGSLEATHVVAVVGSRDAKRQATDFARELARSLTGAGAVVASGGAEGVDAAAHQGALEAKGRTWTIAGTGHGPCYPAAHASLFEAIARGPGAMVWPFAAGYQHRSAFLARNRVLVALADAVVVVQAGFPSGALHAASWARKLAKPLWVVPAAPWMDGFAGSRQLLEQGARPLSSIDLLLDSLRLAPPLALPDSALNHSLSPHEFAVLDAISNVPLHLDEISIRSCQSVPVTAAALLTLALENVVVESPPGFFRRRDSSHMPKITRQIEKRSR